MKKAITVILTVCISILLAMPTFAEEKEPVKYYYYDEDMNRVEASVSDYQIIDSNTTEFKSGKWYVAIGKVSVADRINNSASSENPARLILTDGCTFTAGKGIRVTKGHGIIIYGQENDSGTLNASGVGSQDAGIGGSKSQNGLIQIHGGSIIAKASMNAAGIGSAYDNLTAGKGDPITIFGGFINASGGKSACGIGGTVRYRNTTTRNYISPGSDVYIKGGTIKARAGSDSSGKGGAGIGGGKDEYTKVTISGGWIEAIGELGFPGIGSGESEGKIDFVISGDNSYSIKAGTNGKNAKEMTLEEYLEERGAYILLDFEEPIAEPEEESSEAAETEAATPSETEATENASPSEVVSEESSENEDASPSEVESGGGDTSASILSTGNVAIVVVILIAAVAAIALLLFNKKRQKE